MIVSGSDPKHTITYLKRMNKEQEDEILNLKDELKFTQGMMKVYQEELKLTIERAEEDAAFCDSYR